MRSYTTSQAAKAAGVSRVTLQRWVAAGKVRPPRMRLKGSLAVRVWSERQVRELKKVPHRRYKKK